jgi:hypothetical protein
LLTRLTKLPVRLRKFSRCKLGESCVGEFDLSSSKA